MVTTHAGNVLYADRWREGLGTAFNRLAPEPVDTAPLAGRVAGGQFGAASVFQVTGSPQVVRRSTYAIRDAPADPLKICIQQTGRAVVHQGGRELTLGPGRMAIYDTGRPYELRLEGRWTCLVMAFPREALRLPERLLQAAMARPIDATSGCGAVLAGFIGSCVSQTEGIEPRSRDRVGEAGLHLLVGTLSDVLPVGDQSAPDAQRLQVLTYVRNNLRDPRLSHAQVAAAHRMAERTLHRLFEGQPHTVTEHIRSLRLEAVRRDLADPAFANLSIMSVAARWCFVDQAHFTRLFRATFGTTPTAVRRQTG